MDIRNSVALVTGASGGIGKATAIALAQQGASVIIHYHSHQEFAEEALQACNKFSSKNIIVQADLTQDGDVKVMLHEVRKIFSQINILVNSAGIFDQVDKSDNLKAFESVFRQNFLSIVRVIKAVLPVMDKGKIVNVSSIHGRLGSITKHAVAYSSLKAALNIYTKNLASELAPHILVNAVAPGKTLTPMWGSLSAEEEKELGETQLINRFITSEEVADAILFLIKNDAITGSILDIDGGMSLKVLG